jgi:hypothetical protein
MSEEGGQALTRIRELRSRLEEVEREVSSEMEAVTVVAKRGGATWLDIGLAAGITRQAAHQRWGHLMPPPDQIDLSTVKTAEWAALCELKKRSDEAIGVLARLPDQADQREKDEVARAAHSSLRELRDQWEALAQRVGCDFDELDVGVDRVALRPVNEYVDQVGGIAGQSQERLLFLAGY